MSLSYTSQPIAVTLRDACQYVPFSEDYLRKAVRRTRGNHLPARIAAGKYVVRLEDLDQWLQQEGEPT